jgi:hypothetical protein
MGLFNFLKRKSAATAAPAAAAPGRWVEDTEEYYPNYYGAGKQTKGLGTFSWIGPEPANGKPPNPGTTPEFLAAKEANRLRQIESNAAYAKSQADRRKARDEKDEEERVCKKACDKAIADLRASRANATPAARTRKRNTRKQRKTRSRSRR